MNPKSLLPPLRILALLAGVAGVVGLVAVATRPPEVRLARVETGRVVEVVYATGAVRPDTETKVAPEAAGRLVGLLVDEGDLVRAGQPLAKLDDTEARIRLQEAEQRLETARARLRQAESPTDPFVTRGLEAQLRAAGARHRAAEERVTSLGDRVSTARSSARAAEAAVDGALARARALRNSARAAQSEVLTAQERVTASEAEVAQAAANLEAAADLHRRRQELLRDGAIAERSVTEARTALAAAEAALRAARSRVETSRQAVATARASADAAQSQAEDAESAVETARANASAAQSGVGEAQNAVAEAKRQVDAARADVDALRSQLQQARRGSRAVDVEPVRTEVRTQEATVRWFRRELAKYTVLSPVNGRVTDRPVDPGDYTAPGTRIFTVANEQRIYIRADVDEADIAGVRLGSPVRFQVDAEPGRTYTGRVSLIGRAADRGTKTYPVEIRDLSEVQGLKIGMTADVNIQGRDTPDAVVVSSDALQTDGAQTLVWVLEGDRVKRRPVRIKAKDAGSVQILEGLRAGEQVVLNPAGLSDGRQVRVAGR